jgi:hypothetical protein
MSGNLFGSQRVIGAKADYRRDDFLFARTQSRTMQNLPWEHSPKYARLSWVTPARRARRTRVVRNATLTIAALLLAVTLLPSHHSSRHAYVAGAKPAHTTIVAANMTGL